MSLPPLIAQSAGHETPAGSTRHASDPARLGEARGGLLVLLLLVIPLIGATFLSKLAVPYVKGDGISLGFPLIYLSLILGLLASGRVRMEPARLLAFCVMTGVMGGVIVLRGENLSLASLAFLLLLHLPYVVHIETGEQTLVAARRIFLAIAVVVAACGLAQYVLQSYVPRAYVFPMENLLPESWLATGFNMQAPISYGSNIYRSNGVVMPEPSFYSQLLAIALLLELIGTRKLWRLALLGVALLASQSGTGLVLLAVCLPLALASHSRRNLFIGAIVGLAVLLLLAPYLHLDRLIARVGEFGSERSSAYERFVGGFHILGDSVGTEPLRMLFGYGPGTYRDIVSTLNRPAAEMALFKIVLEYGLVGTVLYFGFMFFCIFSARGPLVLRLALAICLFLNGAYNTFVHSLALALLVWPSPVSARRAAAGGRMAARDSARNGTASPGLSHSLNARPSW